MATASTIRPLTPDATPLSRSALKVDRIGALAATVANVALWAGGRAADVDFLVSPLPGRYQPPDMHGAPTGAGAVQATRIRNTPVDAVHRGVAATDGEQQIYAAVTCSM